MRHTRLLGSFIMIGLMAFAGFAVAAPGKIILNTTPTANTASAGTGVRVNGAPSNAGTVRPVTANAPVTTKPTNTVTAKPNSVTANVVPPMPIKINTTVPTPVPVVIKPSNVVTANTVLPVKVNATTSNVPQKITVPPVVANTMVSNTPIVKPATTTITANTGGISTHITSTGVVGGRGRVISGPTNATGH